MTAPDFDPIPDSLIDDVCRRLAANKSVRQALPGGGILNVDRLLPFLCIYRRDPARVDAGTGLFVKAEGSYLYAPGEATRRKGTRQLVRRIAETAAEHFGAFLFLEIWSADDRTVPRDGDPMTNELLLPQPAFRILRRTLSDSAEAITELEFALQRIKVDRRAARVEITQNSRNHPPRMTQLMSAADAGRLNCDVLGLEILPIYHNPDNGDVYHELLSGLRRGVGRALKKAFFAFALERTKSRPQHYWVLGRRSLSKRVWAVDRQLAEISSQFKFLLLVTPINAERTWHTFSDSNCAREPRFQYRPLESDPLLLKRKLWRIPTEQIEDPTLAHLFRQTQDELDRQISMLSDIGTQQFLPGSLLVYGGVEPSLLELAKDILRHPPDDKDGREMISATAFVRRARREIQYYRRQMNSLPAKAHVRDDMYSGLLFTDGNLLVGRETVIPAKRVEALLQHEIGTHLVTYYNGQAQPLKLLKVGLAAYDALQEGLAVLSEYLVGGLSRGRMRTLAARVVAVAQMVSGAAFRDTFRTLVDDYGFDRRAAYTIVLRVYRGGGLTKDAVYLRGLVEVLDYVGRGGDLELLFVGKLAVDHIPVVRELQLRGVIRPLLLRPRYLDAPGVAERLDHIRRSPTVLALLDE